MTCGVIAFGADRADTSWNSHSGAMRSIEPGISSFRVRRHPAALRADRKASPRNDKTGRSMLTKPAHLFDDATRVTAGDSRWQGHTSPDYWAFVGPFGGATAATVLRAMMEHPQRAGDPLAVTVNYCAPIAEGL